VSPQLHEWLNLIFRWLHVFAAIAWIGHAFLFNTIDSSLALRLPARPVGTARVGDLPQFPQQTDGGPQPIRPRSYRLCNPDTKTLRRAFIYVDPWFSRMVASGRDRHSDTYSGDPRWGATIPRDGPDHRFTPMRNRRSGTKFPEPMVRLSLAQGTPGAFSTMRSTSDRSTRQVRSTAQGCTESVQIIQPGSHHKVFEKSGPSAFFSRR